MTISKVATLVSATWLRDHILSSARNCQKVMSGLRVLDTSWLPDKDVDGFRDFYRESHIPTSLHFDLKKISQRKEDSPVAYPIPDANLFQDYVEELGISNHTHVIAYDRLNSRPSFRAWFLFRLFGHDKVSVLNGGFRQWLTQNFDVTTEIPEVETGKFEVNFRPELLRDGQAMLKNVETQSEQIMDARGANSFYIENEESPGGHIVGSRNIPFASLFHEDGTFKSEHELKKMFDQADIDLSKPLVSSCQTGMTACALLAAARLLGKEDVPLYNGSFSEWSVVADPKHITRQTKPE